jgi:hypothetical protein
LEVILPVVSKEGPEIAQGVFRSVSVDPYNSDPMSYIVPLGYLVSIWQKVCFPSYPEEVDNRKNQQGEGMYDCSQLMKNFLISQATIELVQVPSGTDMRFGKTPNVYAGQCAFFTSTDAQHQGEWGLVEPLQTTQTLELSGTFGTAPFAAPVPPPQEYAFLPGDFSGVVKVPYTGLVGRTEVQPVPPSSASVTLVTQFGGQQPKARVSLEGGIINTQRSFMPLQYINWQQATFFPQNPIANGFWWHLKPGVIANIRIYGTLTEPGVSAVGGEFPAAAFNPMRGEDIT